MKKSHHHRVSFKILIIHILRFRKHKLMVEMSFEMSSETRINLPEIYCRNVQIMPRVLKKMIFYCVAHAFYSSS